MENRNRRTEIRGIVDSEEEKREKKKKSRRKGGTGTGENAEGETGENLKRRGRSEEQENRRR